MTTRAPELGIFEHVRFVHRGQLLAPALGQMESHAGDALDFGPGVNHGVDRPLFGAGAGDAARRAVIHAAGQLADDDHVRAIDQVVLQAEKNRVATCTTAPGAGWRRRPASCGCPAGLFPGAFRAARCRIRADPTAPMSVASAARARLAVSSGKGAAGLVDGDAAQQAFAQRQRVAPLFSDALQARARPGT